MTDEQRIAGVLAAARMVVDDQADDPTGLWFPATTAPIPQEKP